MNGRIENIVQDEQKIFSLEHRFQFFPFIYPNFLEKLKTLNMIWAICFPCEVIVKHQYLVIMSTEWNFRKLKKPFSNIELEMAKKFKNPLFNFLKNWK